MDYLTKEIFNDYGYETWLDVHNAEEILLSDANIARQELEMLEKLKADLAKDVAAYEAITKNLPKKPPGK